MNGTEKPNQRQSRDAARQRDAEAVLRRANAEIETIGTSQLARASERARNHFNGADAPENDPIERWGRIIGRGLSVVVVVLLVLYLYQTYLRGG